MNSKIKILDPVRSDVVNVTIPIILEKYPVPHVEGDDLPELPEDSGIPSEEY